MLGIFSGASTTNQWRNDDGKEISQKNERIKNLIESQHFARSLENDGNEENEMNLEQFIPDVKEEMVEIQTYSGYPIRIPVSVKNYHLIKELGNGGFCAVELATKDKTDELFALKIFPVNALKEKGGYESIFNEIKILSILKHPNIIKCYESFSVKTDEGNEYFIIVMEYVDGATLLDYVNSHEIDEPFLKEMKKILYDLSKIIEYIHGKGISHGDIKLDNVLLDKNMNLKLIDFGFAQICQTCKSIKQNYTVEYAPPELLEGNPYDTFQADIWSLGITFYACVKGYLPYNDDQPIKKQILDGMIDIDLSDDLGKLVWKCTKKNPRERIRIKEILQDPYFQNV